MGFQWIDSPQALEHWLAPVEITTPLYVDTEFVRERTFWADLALIQVRAGDRIALIDAPAIGHARPLLDLIGEYPLVMHACSEDLEVLHYFSGVTPQQVFDTQIAAALAGYDLQPSYQRLVEQIAEKSLPKETTRSNWLARPLSQEQLAYAKADVEWLPTLYEHLKDRLQQLGRQAWWQEECERLSEKALTQTPPENMWRQVKGVGYLQDGMALTRLQQLADWREREARKRNVPRSFILKDALLVQLAEQNPHTMQQLKKIELPAPVIRRYAPQLLERLARSQELAPLPLLPGPPTKEQKKTIQRLRKGVQALSEQLELVPEVLMRRRWLEQWVRQPEVLPEPLQGWRRKVVVEPLLPLL